MIVSIVFGNNTQTVSSVYLSGTGGSGNTFVNCTTCHMVDSTVGGAIDVNYSIITSAVAGDGHLNVTRVNNNLAWRVTYYHLRPSAGNILSFYQARTKTNHTVAAQMQLPDMTGHPTENWWGFIAARGSTNLGAVSSLWSVQNVAGYEGLSNRGTTSGPGGGQPTGTWNFSGTNTGTSILVGVLITETPPAPPVQVGFELVQKSTDFVTCLTDQLACTINNFPQAIGAGHLIVISMAGAPGVEFYMTAIVGGGTYTACTTCRNYHSSIGNVDMAYTTNSVAGATSITVTRSAAAPTAATWYLQMMEIRSGTGYYAEFLQGGTNTLTSSGTTRVWVALTTTTQTTSQIQVGRGSNYQNAVATTTPLWTLQTTSGAWQSVISRTSGQINQTPQVSGGSRMEIAGAIAFREVQGTHPPPPVGGKHLPTLPVMGVGE